MRAIGRCRSTYPSLLLTLKARYLCCLSHVFNFDEILCYSRCKSKNQILTVLTVFRPTEWRNPGAKPPWATQFGRHVAAMATLCRFDWPGNQTPDLTHR